MTAPFGVLAQVAVDEIHAPGRPVATVLGGAGTYAACGLRMATTGPVLLASGVGDDFAAGYGPWLDAWRIARSGLVPRHPLTPRTRVAYRTDDDRTETSTLGADHFARMAFTSADLAGLAPHWEALYVFADAAPGFWRELAQLRRRTGGTVLWELSAAEQDWPRIAAVLADVDVVSLNRSEATGLFGPVPAAVAVRRLRAAGAPVVCLRLGAAGALVADPSGMLRVGPAPASRVVDPTGAGNAFSGAFLGRWAQRRPVEETARVAAAAASFIVEQAGPPPRPPSAAAVAERAAGVLVAPPVPSLTGEGG